MLLAPRTQPETLKRHMGGHDDFTGEFARWLFCTAECPPSYLDLTSPGADADTGISETLRTLYEALLKLESQDYFLSLEAKHVFQAYQNQLVDWALAEHQPGLKTAYPKFESYFARLALWLHIINTVLSGGIPEKFVSEETVARAAGLTDYFIGQLRIIYAHSSPQDELKGRLLDIKQYIDGKPDGVTPRQIRSGNWKLRKVPTSDITQDCKTLESAGYILSKDGRYFPANGSDDGGDDGDDGTSPPPHQPKPPDIKDSPKSIGGSDDVLMMSHHRLQTVDNTSSQPIDDADDGNLTVDDISTGDAAENTTKGNTFSDTACSYPGETCEFKNVSENHHHIITEAKSLTTTSDETDDVASSKHHHHHHIITEAKNPAVTSDDGDDVSSLPHHRSSSLADAPTDVADVEANDKTPEAIAHNESEQPVVSAVTEIEEVESSALSIDTPVANQTSAPDEPLKVDDLVCWDDCPGHLASWSPFKITAIKGDLAMLDIYEKHVPPGQTHLNSPENIHSVVQPHSTLYVEMLFSIIPKLLRIFAIIPENCALLTRCVCPACTPVIASAIAVKHQK